MGHYPHIVALHDDEDFVAPIGHTLITVADRSLVKSAVEHVTPRRYFRPDLQDD